MDPQKLACVVITGLIALFFSAPARCVEQGLTERGGIEKEIEQTEDELTRIRADLEARRKTAAELAGEERGLQGEIDSINEEIRLNRDLIGKLTEKKEMMLSDLELSRHDLDLAEVSLGDSRRLLNNRLRGIYKFGRAEVMEIILLSRTFADLAKRVYYLTMIADHDRKVISDYREKVEVKQVLVAHIESKKAKIEAVEAEAREEAGMLRLKREERDGLVRKLKEKRYYYENLARELEESSRDLEALLEVLEERAREAAYADTTFEGRLGRLMWPCDGKVISEFGMEAHPKFGTIIRNNGVDIRTSPGAGVRCVAPGEVSFAGALSGFGNCVIISHGDGFYTLYGHLESLLVSKGFGVGEGDTIGYIGETSTPEGAVLHFEIRKGKAPLDPGEWFLR